MEFFYKQIQKQENYFYVKKNYTLKITDLKLFIFYRKQITRNQ